MPFNLEIFNEEVYTELAETVPQQVQKFNEASRGTITLVPASNMGDFKRETFFKLPSTVVRRRDVSSDGIIPTDRLSQGVHTSVKVASGTNEILLDPAEYDWTMQNPELAAITFGEQLAVGMVQDMLNTAIMSAVAATNESGVVYDGTAGTANFRVLNRGAHLFGDRANSIAAWLMHSTSLSDIYDTAINNSNNLFEFGTINVVEDGFGRIFIVTDSDSLVNTVGTDQQYSILGLTPGSVNVEQNTDFRATIATSTGRENIQDAFQAQWSYNLKLKGYSWSETNGGPNPSNTAVGTGTNWNRVASSFKDTLGVKIITL